MSKSGDTFSITDLAEEFGVTLRSIRHYEDKGLLAPTRQGMTRIYSRRDRARLKLILRGRRLGFSLDDIQHMLDLYDRDDGQAEQMKFTLEKSRQQLDDLKRRRKDINEAIAELEGSIRVLEDCLEEDAASQSRDLKRA
jgi:DNA-binding transcriptional MerR regulator